jgi:homocysteine S-methyltransferase
MRSIEIVNGASVVLAEGAVIERLNRHPSIRLDPVLINTSLIYDEAGRVEMTRIYREYIDVGYRSDLPFLLATPTWRANGERIPASSYRDKDVIGDTVRFMTDLRSAYGPYGEKVLLGGLLSCKGDSYKPAEALPEKDALEFHRWQVGKLAETDIDFLHAATLPALSEAMGLARAMAETGRPYLLSFVIRPSGHLLDGTSLSRAIAVIDEAVHPKPWIYMVNCVHPTVLETALKNEPPEVTSRLMGIQANTSARSPEELDNSTETQTEEPEVYAAAMVRLHRQFGIKILGGCCGSDGRHIEAIARLLEASRGAACS